MAARTAPTNVVLSRMSVPFVGEANKNSVVITGPYNGVQTGQSFATSDVLTVDADYGVFNTTRTQNADVNSTNFKDPV